MQTQSKTVIGVLAFIVMAVALIIALPPRRLAPSANATYTVHFDADHTNLTLWVSNASPKMLVVDFGVIEALDGTQWKRCPLWSDNPSPNPQIDSLLAVPPYTAMKKQMTAAIPLAVGSWRLHATESEKLSGPEKYYVGLKWHYKSKVPLTTNSFASGSWLGHHRQLIINETGAMSE